MTATETKTVNEEVNATFTELTPQEIDTVKAQIAVLLNYTKQGGSIAAIPEETIAKISPDIRDRLLNEIGRLLTPKM